MNIKTGAALLATAAGALTLSGCMLPAITDESTGSPRDVVESMEPEAESEPTPEPERVAAKELQVNLTVTDKQCFGSAGCNVTVEPELAFTDPAAGSGTYSVTYEITGDESGPIVQTMQVTDGSYEYFPVTMSTESGDVKVSAEVTSVRYWQAHTRLAEGVPGPCGPR